MCGRTVRQFLSSLSFGKYNSGFYYKGRDMHSSAIGGIISLVVGIVLISASIIILRDTLTSKKMYLDETQLLANYEVYTRGGDNDYTFSTDSQPVPYVQDIPIKELFDYLSGTVLFINTDESLKVNCSSITLDIIYTNTSDLSEEVVILNNAPFTIVDEEM